jgi:hypothetical protein
VTCDRSVVFSGYSGFLHQKNWLPRYNWNIVESGTKHHKHKPNKKLVLMKLNLDRFHCTSIIYCWKNKQLGTDHLTRREGYGFLFRSEFFFWATQELEFVFFLLRKARFFFHYLSLGYTTKTLNQIFFFLHQNQNIFLEKNHNPPFKLNGRSLTIYI